MYANALTFYFRECSCDIAPNACAVHKQNKPSILLKIIQFSSKTIKFSAFTTNISLNLYVRMLINNTLQVWHSCVRYFSICSWVNWRATEWRCSFGRRLQLTSITRNESTPVCARILLLFLATLTDYFIDSQPLPATINVSNSFKLRIKRINESFNHTTFSSIIIVSSL